jgi:hypothetical protein
MYKSSSLSAKISFNSTGLNHNCAHLRHFHLLVVLSHACQFFGHPKNIEIFLSSGWRAGV